MVSVQDLLILSYLRQDSRVNLTAISKSTSVPVSTIFDKIKRYNTGLIKRSTVLIDFRKLGYNLKLTILLKVKPESRDSLRKFLESHFNVNSIYRVNNGFDFIIEGIFKNLIQVQDFEDALGQFDILSMQQYYILEEVKEEGFISEPSMIKMV